ncbi:hypothetical protein POPTR_001G313900v4 [Populus trichocarpa]|uniref:Uncharacterized protein n=1 Tax=Populus trichocarpa TaxID=3694 RepID=A0ACC0TMX5_POPTR|nr:hypothetical protein BDE02_01G279700 [Populus trichocarpa]KAI9402701.1 hypothetical protein POPTR_001G313900v4 [Populus trichocarpa]
MQVFLVYDHNILETREIILLIYILYSYVCTCLCTDNCCFLYVFSFYLLNSWQKIFCLLTKAVPCWCMYQVAVTSGTPTIKRSRKKKKLVELREEEILLLKEKRHLKNKLETMRVSLEKERARNESLKRTKFDLLSQHRPEIFTASVKSEDVISMKPQETKVACDSTYSVLPHNVSFQLQEDEGRKPSFTLPDLNLPVDGDSGSGILG